MAVAGEIDCLEALEHVQANYRIDPNRILVRGFSMGGAAAWNFAVHYADRWAAANPGAGFSETPEFLKFFQEETLEPTWYEKKLWHLYDCTDYAVNLFNLPTVAYSGEIDRQKQAADIMAEALENDGLSIEQARKLKVIRESGDHLLSILNDILDFSKIEANRIDFEKAPFRLSDIARKVESLHSLKAREKGLEFSVSALEPDLSRLGDAHRIVQILHNLVGNAVKFTSRGGVYVKIDAGADGADLCVIEVADTGIGMTPEQTAKIFDPFAQADTTTARRYGGTGLGLSIAEGLARSMGGSIRVVSELGRGSQFIVALPLPPAPESAAPGQTPGAPKPERAARPARILAAEDNGVNRAVLHALLAPMGHRVDFAEDGPGAIDAFRREMYDVVLMDISMPEMDGVEAMNRLRAIEAERGGARTPVIAVSAHAMRQQIEEYLAAGFDGYVTKPVTTEKLNAEINRVLTKSETRAA